MLYHNWFKDLNFPPERMKIFFLHHFIAYVFFPLLYIKYPKCSEDKIKWRQFYNFTTYNNSSLFFILGKINAVYTYENILLFFFSFQNILTGGFPFLEFSVKAFLFVLLAGKMYIYFSITINKKTNYHFE